MVFIIDDGSRFKAPLDKIWALHQSDEGHDHPSLKNLKGEEDGEHFIATYEATLPDGSSVVQRTRTTAYPPLGVVFEVLEGPLAGSKFFEYYAPKGEETGVTVVGEFSSKMIPAAELQKTVMGFLEVVFEEDQKNLAKM